MTLRLAGEFVDRPMDFWRDYARYQRRAVVEYDLPDRGHPGVLTEQEVWRSRVIRSRATHAEKRELPGVWSTAGAASLPVDAHIRDADPLQRGGPYDEVMRVVAPFIARTGVSWTKAYKILHVKRPHLFPLLDRQLRRLYAKQEADFRLRNLHLLPPGFNYWAVIRLDVLHNHEALIGYRRQLAAADGLLPRLADLSDVRLLDMICWRLAKFGGGRPA